jgi:RNA polymerase sigma factor (sigma-70 family)
MADRTEKQLFADARDGDDSAFERIYDLYHQRVRLTAWRISHRPDWVDELVNEAWCRAFEQRKRFNPDRPFLVWMAGIVLNVYREHCRQSPTTLGGPDDLRPTQTDDPSPEMVASEAEILVGLNDCVARLAPQDAQIVRLRFFAGKTLRLVAQEVAIAEATLRERDLPRILGELRRCMEAKGLKISDIFSAQGGLQLQYPDEEST